MSEELQQLSRALWAAQTRQRGAYDRALARIGTTFPQWFALTEIGRHPGSSSHRLAGRTFQSDQSFGALANRLESQGLIVRSPGEGRRVAHHLTTEGEAVLSAADAIGEQVLDRSFAEFDAAESLTLRALLDRVAMASDLPAQPSGAESA